MKTATHIAAEHKQVRNHCGWFSLPDWALVAAVGKDTYPFLQTQTTNEVIQLETGAGVDNAVVDRKARLLCTFSIHKESEKRALILVQQHQRDRLLQTLETYLFREDIHFDPEPPESCLIALQGPKSPVILEQLTGQALALLRPNDMRRARIGDHELLVFSKSLTGEDGYILALPTAARGYIVETIQEAGEAYGILEVSEETREVLRIEAGIPVYGRDMDDSNILPETGLEHTSVSYHKGCYIGQEVIARIKTYGSPAFALMGLLVEGDRLPPFDGEIRLGTRNFGTVKSATWSCSLERTIALAYIQKEFRSPGQKFKVTINGEPFTVTTALLPFHQTTSRTERAQALHRQALELYKKESDLEKPISLLRESIALDPKYAAGYEALGVMLSRQNKLDEAIALMKRLAEIDPGEIMAHTNLSIYYMQQGRIEEAELEKAEATAIQFEKMVEEGRAKKEREARARKNQEEQQRQLEMFKKVLTIDPVDQVANFGLGTIYLDLGQYEEALAPLRTVVEHHKDYSAAWLALGKTLEKLGRAEEAAEVYKKGIAAASKKGDLMPLKDMQNRLNQILHTSS